MDPADDAALAHRIATEAGAMLAALRERMWAQGAARWQVMDHGDMASHELITNVLRTERPGDAILSEEGLDDPRRRLAERVWIVDPLDGTNEFGEPGRPDWAVHVALWAHGELVAGAVGMPMLGRTFGSHPPEVLGPPTRERPRLVTSRTRAPYAASLVAQRLGADAVRLGSAGAKAMAVLTGDADIYIHDGGMYQWDSAAPAIVAARAGLHVSRIDGSPLVYNDPDPWLPDFVVCRPEWAEPVLRSLPRR